MEASVHKCDEGYTNVYHTLKLCVDVGQGIMS